MFSSVHNNADPTEIHIVILSHKIPHVGSKLRLGSYHPQVITWKKCQIRAIIAIAPVRCLKKFQTSLLTRCLALQRALSRSLFIANLILAERDCVPRSLLLLIPPPFRRGRRTSPPSFRDQKTHKRPASPCKKRQRAHCRALFHFCFRRPLPYRRWG